MGLASNGGLGMLFVQHPSIQGYDYPYHCNTAKKYEIRDVSFK